MKKLLTLLLIVLLGATVTHAQVRAQEKMGDNNCKLATAPEAKSIKGRKLAVVPLGNADEKRASAEELAKANEELLKAVAALWNFTDGEPEIITGEQLKQLRKEKDVRYVVLAFDHLLEERVRMNTPSGTSPNESQRARMSRQAGSVATSDSYVSPILTLELPERRGCAYRFELPSMTPTAGQFGTGIMEMQDYLNEMITKGTFNAKDHLKANSQLLKTKTLLVNEAELDKNLTEEQIKKTYPHKYMLVPAKFIEEAILNRDSNYLYLQLTPSYWYVPEAKTHRIYDAQTGKVAAMTISSHSQIEPKHFKYYQYYLK